VPILADRPAPAGPLFPYLADPARAEAQVADWEAAYGFEARRLAPETETVRDALYLLGMVAAALDDAGVELPDPLDVLDIGAKNWHYVRALWALLAGYGGARRELALKGIEIDPFVVYRDGHSRYDWAKLYARSCPGTHYLVGDALAHEGQYDLVLVLFPIMLPDEHLDWGLPLDRYRPHDLLAHAWKLTRSGGTLLVTCYDYERQALEATWRYLGLAPVLARPHASELADYDMGRFVTVLQRA